MLTYIGRFWSGGFEPFWPHVVLLTLSIVASFAVGIGIIFERPKYSPAVHRVAFWLIVGGITIEAVCTIFLFVFDEGISGSLQKSNNFLLAQQQELEGRTSRARRDAAKAQASIAEAKARQKEAELKLEQLRIQVGPRHLQARIFISALAGKPKAPVEIMFLKDDGDAFRLALEIRGGLQVASWQVGMPMPIPSATAPELANLPSAMGVGGQPNGVTVVVKEATEAETKAFDLYFQKKPYVDTPFTALHMALLEGLGGAAAHVGGSATPAPGVLRVVIGPKP